MRNARSSLPFVSYQCESGGPAVGKPRNSWRSIYWRQTARHGGRARGCSSSLPRPAGRANKSPAAAYPRACPYHRTGKASTFRPNGAAVPFSSGFGSGPGDRIERVTFSGGHHNSMLGSDPCTSRVSSCMASLQTVPPLPALRPISKEPASVSYPERRHACPCNPR
jgi:hypothetical protein